MGFCEHLASKREDRIQYGIVEGLVGIHIVRHQASELNGFQGQEEIQYGGRSCHRDVRDAVSAVIYQGSRGGGGGGGYLYHSLYCGAHDHFGAPTAHGTDIIAPTVQPEKLKAFFL